MADSGTGATIGRLQSPGIYSIFTNVSVLPGADLLGLLYSSFSLLPIVKRVYRRWTVSAPASRLALASETCKPWVVGYLGRMLIKRQPLRSPHVN